MRAKRSKKYRKVMNQYALTFGFREPYQVLVDANFLIALHAYKMELIPSLERTLQGKVKPLITRCTLSRLLSSQASPPSSASSSTEHRKPVKTKDPTTGATTTRPSYLPPPTTLPLRHCPHDPPVPENQCLLSLLSSTPIVSAPDDIGNDDSSDAPSTQLPPTVSKKQKPNRYHYVLATASPIHFPSATSKNPQSTLPKAPRQAQRQAAEDEAQEFRSLARQIPGVPICYLKRSVLILEPLSERSSGVRGGMERGKMREGILPGKGKGKANGKKRKRELEEEEDDGDDDDDNDHGIGRTNPGRDDETGEVEPLKNKKKRKKEYGFHKSKNKIESTTKTDTKKNKNKNKNDKSGSLKWETTRAGNTHRDPEEIIPVTVTVTVPGKATDPSSKDVSEESGLVNSNNRGDSDAVDGSRGGDGDEKEAVPQKRKRKHKNSKKEQAGGGGVS